MFRCFICVMVLFSLCSGILYGEDDKWLYYGIRIEGKYDGIALVTDNNADGFYYGNDNLYIEIGPDSSLRNARMHLASDNRWPYFDDEYRIFKIEDLQYSKSSEGDVQTIELAIPERQDIGLSLKDGSKIGLMFYVGVPDHGQISLFEPYNIFDSTIK